MSITITLVPFSFILIPVLPSIVIAPSEVEKLDAAAASSDNAEDASILIAAPSISTVCPAPFSVNVPPVDVTVTPPAPANVNVNALDDGNALSEPLISPSPSLFGRR